jgi:hypothetical protein
MRWRALPGNWSWPRNRITRPTRHPGIKIFFARTTSQLTGEALVAGQVLVVGAEETSGRLDHQRLEVTLEDLLEVFRFD